MPITVMSSREFNRDVGKAKRAALQGPVMVTDRGEPTHVLLSIEAYRNVTAQDQSIGTALAWPFADDVDFDPPKLDIGLKIPEFD